jgi:hypothetical protein
MVIDGMGHDLPAPLLPQLVGAIAAHCRAADAARAPLPGGATGDRRAAEYSRRDRCAADRNAPIHEEKA